MKRPNGIDEIVEAYGPIYQYIRSDGTLLPDWERHYLVTIDLPAPIKLGFADKYVTRIRCNKALAEQFIAAFKSVHAAGLWSELRTFEGCFKFRTQRGSPSKLSLHSWGAAVDFNGATNPLGEPGDMSQGVIDCFEAVGFYSGRRFERRDDGHLQAASGY